MITLNNILKMNGLSCISFGVLFLALPGGTAVFLGGEAPAPAWLIAALGAVLICNGLHLFWTARDEQPPQQLVWYFSAGDFAWVLGTLILLVGNIWITTISGIIAALIVAICVGVFGGLQLLLLRS